MTEPSLEVDYLIIGAGASGMGFADVMLRESDATIAIIDRRQAPGGHWNDAYPFVRLHQPSHYYGVESRALGDFSLQGDGLLHAASAAEIVAYYDAIMQRDFLPSGRVSHFPMSQYEGEGQFSSLLTDERRKVKVRKRIVDTTYMATAVPSTHVRPFAVAPGVACIPPNELPRVARPASRYTIVGSGKTGMDACLWLQNHGVAPDRIRWIMPRDAWWLDRLAFQMSDGFFEVCVSHVARQMETLAEAASVEDLFKRLESIGALFRLDHKVKPTMYHGASITTAELATLRRVADVIRLGRVQRIEPDKIVLDHGVVAAGADDLYVDCTAQGVGCPPTIPVFGADKITVQMLKIFQPSFSAAFIAHVEASYDDDAIKNDLCMPVEPPQYDTGWLRMMAGTLRNTARWSADPAIMAWIAKSRLDPLTNLVRKVDENDAEKQALVQRMRRALKPAAMNLHKLMATA